MGNAIFSNPFTTVNEGLLEPVKSIYPFITEDQKASINSRYIGYEAGIILLIIFSILFGFSLLFRFNGKVKVSLFASMVIGVFIIIFTCIVSPKEFDRILATPTQPPTLPPTQPPTLPPGAFRRRA